MQRVFDMENEQDVKDLFDILPSNIPSIRKINNGINGAAFCFPYNLGEFHVSWIKIKWGSLDHVDRPVDKSKWIGCLVWAWDDAPANSIIGELIEIRRDESPFIIDCGLDVEDYKHCRPVKRSEIKFVEDME